MQKALYDAVEYMLIASLSWTESLQQTSDFRNHLSLEICKFLLFSQNTSVDAQTKNPLFHHFFLLSISKYVSLLMYFSNFTPMPSHIRYEDVWNGFKPESLNKL